MTRFYLDCEVLLPAAKENVITSANADRIKTRIICEGANGPTTSEADAILADKNIFVLPDISRTRAALLCRILSGCRTGRVTWNEQLVNGRLEEIMVNSFKDVVAMRTSTKFTTGSRRICWPSIVWPSL